MIIDRAKEDDIGRLEELWYEAFGDDKEIIELFMSKVLNSAQTYVARKSGIIVSVLYALPTIDDNYYLYALATDADYRNRGYMSALIRYFIDHFDAGYFFLIPGEEELVSYYEELGFDVHVPAGIRSNVKNIFNEIEEKYPAQKKGVFLANDTYASMFLNLIFQKYGKLPKDYQIVGFDDSPIASEAILPITTVGQQIEKIAQTAMELLVLQMNEMKKRKPTPLKEPVHKQITPVLI